MILLFHIQPYDLPIFFFELDRRRIGDCEQIKQSNVKPTSETNVAAISTIIIRSCDVNDRCHGST